MAGLLAVSGEAAEANPEEIDIDAGAESDEEMAEEGAAAAAGKDDFEPDVAIGQKAVPAAVFGSAGLTGDEGMGAMERLKKRKTGA